MREGWCRREGWRERDRFTTTKKGASRTIMSEFVWRSKHGRASRSEVSV